METIRYALRQLRLSPGFALAAILTLALGIGANTAIFTLIDGILLRTLPVANPSQLYRIGDTGDCCVNGGFVGNNGDFDIFSYALYKTFQAATPEFTSLAAVQAGLNRASVRWGTSFAQSLRGELVSGNYFTTLGVPAYLGRTLLSSDDQIGAPATVVVSYSTWRNQFGGERGLLGSTLRINARPYTVVGIAPPGFFGDRVTDQPPDFWAPLSTLALGQNLASTLLRQPSANWLYPIGRVRPGTSIPALQAQLSATLRHWLSGQQAYTANGAAVMIPKQHVTVVSAGGGVQTLQQQSSQALLLLMALAGLVLLIACANIANLLLARGAARRSDVAVRMALGESRARLVRRLLGESLVLGALGGVAGLGVAYLGSRTILALMFPDAASSPIAAAPNWTVLGFAVLISLVAAGLFGLAPAWTAARAEPAEALRGTQRTLGDRSHRWQSALVIFQIALSLVLLVGAALTSRSLGALESQNFGVATSQRYVLHFEPEGAGYTPAQMPTLNRRVEESFARLPGVASVGLAMYSPLEGDNWGECVIQQGHPAPGPHDRCGSSWDRVSPGFLSAIGVPILEGRGFTTADTATSPMVAVVNQTFVKRFFPHQDPIGQHFGIDHVQYSGAFEIVGVFRDFKLNNPRDPVRPLFLRPMDQHFNGYTENGMQATENNSMYLPALVVDFNHLPPAPDALLHRTLAGVDPNLIVANVETFQAQVADNFDQERLMAGLSSLFGLLALVLACIGLYGVTSYIVARRTGEIAVRMALGASRGRVIGHMLRSVGVQVGLGLAIGIPAAIAVAKLIASQLYHAGTYDAVALAAPALVLAAFAALAGWLPSRRAAGVDPARTLREG